jgi:integrase
MARLVNRLTDRTVRALKEPGLYPDGGGLYLELTKGGSKQWAYIFQWRKKRTQMGLGGFGTVSLGEARVAAEAARKQVKAGVNPIEARKAEKMAARTFGDMADMILAAKASSWKNAKHKGQWETSLNEHAKPIRAKALGDITTDDILDVLKPIWERIPETASRTRGRIELVLDAAKANGLRGGDNPARWKGHLIYLLPKRKKLYRGHHPALGFDEIGGFMAALREREAMAARALEFTILTAARTGETLGATWGEFELYADVWTVPADRMKAGVQHRVPLSEASKKILTDLARGSNCEADALVFPSAITGRVMSNMAMLMLLRRMTRPDLTVHGFRSTFRDWAGEVTNFPREVVEAALAHTVGNEVELAYRRGDALLKRRRLMEAWASFCARTKSANIHELRRA